MSMVRTSENGPNNTNPVVDWHVQDNACFWKEAQKEENDPC